MKKKHRRSAAPPPPPMLVGDEERAEGRVPESPARVPEPPPGALDPAGGPPVTPPQDLRSRLQAFFALPPDPAGRPPVTPPQDLRSRPHAFSSLPPDPPEERYPAVGSGGENGNRVGCLAVLVLVVVGGIVEEAFTMGNPQRYLGLGVFAVVVALIGLWTTLHDSDLAYSDRDSDGRMARVRNRLRRLFNIPVI
ncbi:MAG: hypothetical protein KY467_08495 [Gemmatimonadetes bacterium]|nr:hypothetical protein [Gemmatimonadota bacterium]